VVLRGADEPDRAAMPAGITGAIVMSHVGPTAPGDLSVFKLEGATCTEAQVLFPETLAPGTQVWLTAAWMNYRKEMGPACTPVGTQINYGGSLPMAA
jgi:hypothetical protein